jgi:cytochrome c peroxidase
MLKKLFFLSLAVLIFLPLSNLLGLQGKNELIPALSEQSDIFRRASAILQEKCVDCHAPGMARMPIYAQLPVAKQLMAHHIEMATERMILNKSLFNGDASFSPLLLARIEHVLRNDMMPPGLFLIMHWDGGLSDEERQTLLAWVAEERGKHPWSKDHAADLKGEPIQALPLQSAVDADKVNLGKRLFHDKRLSGDNSLSCASCHDLTKGGTDQAPVSTGIRGQHGPINSPTVYNAMYNLAQFWDGRAKDLQEQAAGPVANPLEMGAQWDEVLQKLKQDAEYQQLFTKLYPQQGLTKTTVTDAIAIFEQSLVTGNSRFDQYLRGNQAALISDELEGYELFKANCASCHFGPALGGLSYEKMGVKRDYFIQRGTALTDADNGRFNVTKQEKDRHFFKVPVLRNIDLTYPYFHDGSVISLADAVQIMGEVQLDKTFSPDEIAKLVAFLSTLTGEYQGKPLMYISNEDIQ